MHSYIYTAIRAMFFYLLPNHLMFCVEEVQDREINILIAVPEKNHVEIKNRESESAVLTSVVICSAKIWEGFEK